MSASPERANCSAPAVVGRTLGNTALLMGTTIATRGLAYVQFLLVVRAFSEYEVGFYAVCLTGMLMAEMLANLGLDRVVIRDLACEGRFNEESHKIFDNSVILKFVTSMFTYLLCLGIFRVAYPELYLDYWRALAAFFAYVPLCGLARCFENHFTAMEWMAIPAVGQIAERMVLLGAATAGWFGYLGLNGFLASFFLAALVRGAIPGVVFLYSRTDKRLIFCRRQARRLLSDSSLLFALEIIAVAYFRVDIFMLSKMAGLASTALYQAAYKIFDFFIAMFTGYITAIFPAMARNDKRLSPAMLALGAAAIFVFFTVPVLLFRREIMGLFKPEYVQATNVLVCLMLTLPIVYANSLIANHAVATNNLRALMLVALFMLIVNILLNFALIPRFGILGAALATLAGEVLLIVLLLWILQPFSRNASPIGEVLEELP